MTMPTARGPAECSDHGVTLVAQASDGDRLHVHTIYQLSNLSNSSMTSKGIRALDQMVAIHLCMRCATEGQHSYCSQPSPVPGSQHMSCF